eukprot:g1084.t1
MNSKSQDKTQTGHSQNGRRRPRPRKNQHCWSPRHLNGKFRSPPIQWSASEWLKPWKESLSNTNRFFYGTGNGQVLLEREEEEGVWKVMTVPGFRFSPIWLETIARWSREFHDKISATDQNQTVIKDPMIDHGSSGTASDPGGKPGTSSAATQCSNRRICCLSLRCERMGLTDMELEMISKWHRDNSKVLNIIKLWLFDNKITDVGAPNLAQLIRNDPLLLEIHVSHNSMTNKGAEQIMNTIAACRDASSKPFWLRMEWNTINNNELKHFISELENEKEIVVDIPRFHLKRSKGRVTSCLINEKKVAHFRLPWIQCQRLRPSEAPVLMQAKSSWQQRPVVKTAQTHTNNRPHPVSTRGRESYKRPTTRGGKASTTHQRSSKGQSKFRVKEGGGPLLIFPDTSALLGLIGCKTKSNGSSSSSSQNSNSSTSPYLSFDWLESLCQKGKFGNCIPSNERIFFVLCDSVMKQLDGLKKHNANVGLCVRKLVNSGLEKYGPAGQDFLTILGAHEGEGIIVDRNAELLDSRSHHVFNKGQAIDLKIVEVALFFQQELCQAHHSQPHSSNTNTHTSIPNPKNPFHFPVVLFSNDNVQLTAAKSHGLPAFRYTDLQKFNHVREIMQPRKPLTASTLRAQIAGKATSGLGACARKSLQDEFDGIVACMKHLMESYEGARTLLGQTREILGSNSEDKLNQLKQLLDIGQQQQEPVSDEEYEDSTGSGGGASSLTPVKGVEHEIQSQDSTTTALKSSSLTNTNTNSNNNKKKRTSESESSTTTFSDHVTPNDDFEDFSLFDDGTSLDDINTNTDNDNTKSENNITTQISNLDSDETKNSENNNNSNNNHNNSDNNSSSLVCSNEISTSEGSSDDETIPLVRAKLVEWETLVKSYQHPSRILRWTSGQLYPE